MHIRAKCNSNELIKQTSLNAGTDVGPKNWEKSAGKVQEKCRGKCTENPWKMQTETQQKTCSI